MIDLSFLTEAADELSRVAKEHYKGKRLEMNIAALEIDVKKIVPRLRLVPDMSQEDV